MKERELHTSFFSELVLFFIHFFCVDASVYAYSLLLQFTLLCCVYYEDEPQERLKLSFVAHTNWKKWMENVAAAASQEFSARVKEYYYCAQKYSTVLSYTS